MEERIVLGKASTFRLSCRLRGQTRCKGSPVVASSGKISTTSPRLRACLMLLKSLTDGLRID
jgi:hypothetical protein